MGQDLAISGGRDLSEFKPQQLELLKRTVAKGCNDDEFRQFVHTARHLGLDPLRRQIYAFVFNKNKNNRSMSIVVGIDGARKIAAKAADYRPDQDEPDITYNDDLKSPCNPLGIEKAVVRVYKHAHGDWHPVPGVAYWDEFAPVSYPDHCYEWVDTGRTYEDSGKPIKAKRLREGVTEKDKALDTSGQWGRMPRVMIAKCAEMQALRRGWPDDLSNVYEHSELDQAKIIDIDPVDAVAEAERSRRMERIGGPQIMMIFEVGDPLVGVPAGKLADKAIAHMKTIEASAKLKWFKESNAEALRQLWGHDKTAGLEVNKAYEDCLASLLKQEEADQ